MQLFYSPDIVAAGFCTLDAEESRHAVRVMRLRAGDGLNVTDGRGSLYECRIVTADDRACVVESVGSLPTTHSPLPTLHLAVAPTKNPSRMEWLVEKAVEMGVGEITLLQCDHSERSFLKTDRLEKLAVSAMKQSLRCWLPAIRPAVKLSDWLAALPDQPSAQRFIAHCEDDQPRVALGEVLEQGRETVVLIGPEGDFSRQEIEQAMGCGFRAVSFGTARLRTETAALYAVAAYNYVNNR
jgi:16S rRNA (uracil1498-N3)-methyltransferase